MGMGYVEEYPPHWVRSAPQQISFAFLGAENGEGMEAKRSDGGREVA